MSYCPKCGNKVDETMVFCPRCGASLKAVSDRSTCPPPAQPYRRRNEKSEKNEKQEKQTNAITQRKAKNKRKVKLALSAI